MRYLSEPWAEAALALVETDERIAKALRGLELSLLTLVQDGPPDTYGFMYVAFSQGGLEEYRVGHDYNAVAHGIPKPTFVVSGTYDVFASIMRGELGEKRALLTGKLHLTGSLMKALRHMHAMETMTTVLQDLPLDD